MGAVNQFKSYSDKGYIQKSHGLVAHRHCRHGIGLPELVIENTIMSSIRIGVEWKFNDICQKCSFMDNYKLQKIQLSQVAKLYWASALLANCSTCLNHSNSSTYFECRPPSLEEYFQL